MQTALMEPCLRLASYLLVLVLSIVLTALAAVQTNNPRKIEHIRDLGIKVTDRVPCIVEAQAFSQNYLAVKKARMQHDFDGSYCFWNHDGNAILPAPVVPSLLHNTKLPKALSSTDDESSTSTQSEE